MVKDVSRLGRIKIWEIMIMSNVYDSHFILEMSKTQ